MFQYYANNNICHLCTASKTDPTVFYTQCGANAGWQQGRRTHQDSAMMGLSTFLLIYAWANDFRAQMLGTTLAQRAWNGPDISGSNNALPMGRTIW